MLPEIILDKIRNAEMLNFGSGPSAYAFDYEAAGINGVNLAMTPSAFALETAFLKEYSPVFPKGCLSVFTVCPFSFGNNLTKGSPTRYSRYYGVLSRKAIDALPPPLAHWNASAAASINAEAPLFPYGNAIHRDEIPAEAIMEERTNDMCEGWKKEFNLPDFLDPSHAASHQEAFRRERNYLCILLSYAKEIGLRPLLMLPPMHPMLQEKISPAFFEAFVLRQLQGIDCPVCDFSRDTFFSGDMFLGPVFLNKNGAKALTQRIYDLAMHSRIPNKAYETR